MAPPPSSLHLPSGFVFEPTGRDVISHYLVPMALRGELPLDTTVPGGLAEGVDVFSARPEALPFPRDHRREHGEVWGYFFGAQPTGDQGRRTPGGAWLPSGFGGDKPYSGGDGGEAIAFRRRFAFHVRKRAFDGSARWPPTRWLMKEYRLNKGAAAFSRARAQPEPRANMDSVVRKVYVKPMPPPPLHSSYEESSDSDYSRMDEESDHANEH